MTGVFISYTRSDEALARRVRLGLKSLGVEVLWDESMLAVEWQSYLEKQINDLPAVIAIWTPRSIDSDPVKDEARLGQSKKKLINIVVDVAQPPWPFERTNGLSLKGWTSLKPHTGWSRLVASIDDCLEKAGVLAAGTVTSALAQQEADIRERSAAIPAFERALSRAERDHEKLEKQVFFAKRECEAAATQILELRKIKASKAVMAAAQAERDDANVLLNSATQQVAASLATLEQDKASIDRMKADLDAWLVSIGADLHHEPAKPDTILEDSKGASAEPESSQLSPIDAKTPETLLVENETIETVPIQKPVIGEIPSVENSIIETVDPAVSVATLSQPSMSTSSNKTTIRRTRSSQVPLYLWSTVAGLAVLLLLILSPYFRSSPEPGASNAGAGKAITTVETTQNKEPLRLDGLKAPNWLLGKWGIEGDCSNILVFTKEDGANVGVQVGEGSISNEAIKEQFVAEIRTNEAKYVLELPNLTRIKVFPNDLEPYGLEKCQKT